MEREVAVPANLSIGELFNEQKARLKLDWVAGRESRGRPITLSDVNRPGLALAGHLEHFRAERIQIIGRGEQAFCVKTEPKGLFSNLSKMFSQSTLPCMLITRGLGVPRPLEKACRRFKVPLLRSRLDTAVLVGELTTYLEDRLAPVTRVHGVLVDVYGLGVLIQGDSGIGKSECALELLKRGHILVADDVVEIQKRRGEILLGRCPEAIKHHMEVRGLGILDVKLLFGIGSILKQSRIEFVVQLEMWRAQAAYDRTGLEHNSTRLLGVPVPVVRVPVSPGRNLAILIEVAALNQRLKLQGHSSAELFNEQVIARMRRRAGA